MLILKIILLIVLFSMFYQDVTERRVYWFLFPILAICSGILFYNNTLSELFYVYIIINSILVLTLLLAAFLYTKFKLKIEFSEALGLGDILLFVGLIFSFSSISFLVIFVFSLVFSLVLHLFVKKHTKYKTVPLAGYMSLFFAFAYVSYWLNITSSLYTL